MSLIFLKLIVSGIAKDYLKYENGNTIKEGDKFKIVSGVNNNYVVDLQNGSTSNSSNVQLYQDNNSATQRFMLKAVAKDDNYYNIAVA